MEIKILSKINKNILNIKKGFAILPNSYVADGYDEYGPKYWVSCDNGWEGRKWNINSAIENEISEYIKSIYNFGIDIENNTYYIGDICQNINNLNLNHIIIINDKT